MSILALTSNTLVGTAAAGQIEYDGQFFATDSNASRAQIQRLVQGTAVASTSGTSIDFTGIPAWAKKITVMFSGVSTNGTSLVQIQLGDAGGIETTGYTSGALGVTGLNACFQQTSTTGFAVIGAVAAATRHGQYQFSKLSSNTWSGIGCLYRSDDGVSGSMAGSKELSATLDRIRITTVNGTDTFDAGSINIMYEG